MDYKIAAKQNRILEIRVGSHLFGTNTAESDIDLYGIFMPFDEIVFGTHKYEHVNLDIKAEDASERNTKDAIDRSLVEYRKFIKLALQNNPNILNVLFANKENVVFKDTSNFGARLLDTATMFPHKGAYRRYVEYAKSQLKKMLNKPASFHEVQAGLAYLDEVDPSFKMRSIGLSKPRVSAFFKDLGTGKHIVCGKVKLDRTATVEHTKQKLKESLESMTNRTNLYTQHGYDTKFGSNAILLLKQGIELMSTGKLQFPLVYKQDILNIKQGKYPIKELINWADTLKEEANTAFRQSDLPMSPQTKKIETFAIAEVKDFLYNLEGHLL